MEGALASRSRRLFSRASTTPRMTAATMVKHITTIVEIHVVRYLIGASSVLTCSPITSE